MLASIYDYSVAVKSYGEEYEHDFAVGDFGKNTDHEVVLGRGCIMRQFEWSKISR